MSEVDTNISRAFDMGTALAKGAIDAFLSGEPFPTLAGEAYLEVADLSHSFTGNGNGRYVLHNASFNISRGELICLIGRSGCGKSTVLNILAGFLHPTSGRCLLEGQAIVGPGPDRCVVFQEDALFPWLTVRENVAFGFKTGNLQKKENMQELLLYLWRERAQTILFVTHDDQEAIALADRVLLLEADSGRIREELVVRLDKPRDRGSEVFQTYCRQLRQGVV
ncbi:MAG: ATP-binding cassette domain-containing protein [Pseudomonadota bacterium]